jgi:hypothetical protein
MRTTTAARIANVASVNELQPAMRWPPTRCGGTDRIVDDWASGGNDVMGSKPGGRETHHDAGREVYFEFVAIGRAVKVTAIDSRTALEVSAVGPATASQADLRQLALQKLKRRLERQ